jgi:branched-chain amino acid transport system permease protein
MFTQQLLNGLGIGCTYALIALGYNLIFGVLRVVNVAYGEIFMVSAFATFVLADVFPGQPILTVAATLLVAVLAGLVVHLIGVKPLGEVTDINSPRHLSVIISTLGCSVVLQYLAIELFGAYPHRVPRLFPERSFKILNSQVDLTLILNIVISLVAMFLLYALLNRTLTGLRMRAVSENSELARCGGQMTSWCLSHKRSVPFHRTSDCHTV